MEAIIQSHDQGASATKPSIINPSRKRRIAAGSGTRVEDVNRLLRQFEQMQKMMKQFKKNPKGVWARHETAWAACSAEDAAFISVITGLCRR